MLKQPLAVILLTLGLASIVLSLIVALIGGTSIDLDSILGAAALVVLALAVGVGALFSGGE